MALVLKAPSPSLPLRTAVQGGALSCGRKPNRGRIELLERLTWHETVHDDAQTTATDVLLVVEAAADVAASTDVAVELFASTEVVAVGTSAQDTRLEALALGEARSDSSTETHATTDAVTEGFAFAEARGSIAGAVFAGAEVITAAEAGASSGTFPPEVRAEVYALSEAWFSTWASTSARSESVLLSESMSLGSGWIHATAETLALLEYRVDRPSQATGAPLVESGTDAAGAANARTEAFALTESRADSFVRNSGTADALSEAVAVTETRTDAYQHTTQAWTEARTEAVSATESNASKLAVTETTAEVLELARIAATEAVVETLTSAESSTDLEKDTQARPEALSVSEAVAVLTKAVEGRSEALAASEARSDSFQHTVLSWTEPVSEAPTFAESRTDALQTPIIQAWTEAGTEAVATSEAGTSVWAATQTATEALTLSGLDMQEPCTETIAVTEARVDAVRLQPKIVARGTVSAVTTQTVSVNIPASTSGDILLALIEERINADTGSHSVTGFAQVGTTQRIGYSRISAWWLRSAGTTGSTTVSMSKSGANYGTMCVIAIRSADSSATPWDTGSDATLRSCATTGTSVTVPGITTATPLALVLAVIGHGHAISVAETFSYASGGVATVNTTVAALQAGATTTRIAGTVFWGAKAAAGATGNQVFTGNSATSITTTYPVAGYLLAVKAFTS